MKTAIWLAMALAVMMCITPVYSQGGRGPGGPPPVGGMMVPPPPPAAAIDPITKAFSLTTDQAAALKTILTAGDTAIDPLRKTAADANKAVKDALVALDFDSAADLAVTASTAQLNVANAMLSEWSAIQASAIFTTDQFAQLLAGPGPGGPPPMGPPPSGNGSSGGRRSR